MPDIPAQPIDQWSWSIGKRVINLRHRGMIMGILNVTPDSFSDGGRFSEFDTAVRHALDMVRQGADIIDVGGESTRPGSSPVCESDELQRVIPIIEALRGESDVLISIDTSKAAVAEAALAAGADIINDVAGLRSDANMLDVAAATNAGLVIMHMKGEPRTMQAAPHYDDVCAEISAFFREREATALAAGIPRECILFDPGIGFGKTVSHNLQLLNQLDQLSPGGRPLLLGVSRKSFIARVLESEEIADRYWPTVALTSFARERGARVFRVHDVEPNYQALRMTEAILAAGEGKLNRLVPQLDNLA
ncbi:MAG: dihydropteroate synthase [Verrucomicrobiae bacterium]|nr:dihydropteroate synthase [Verrucomicrobiae bacterium]